MNSPRYLRMLVDGVRELDELKLWSSWKSQGKDLELLGFKEKLRYLAREKGDNGKVALLESSVGLSLSSAMNVARYLSAETLPGLIDKVRARARNSYIFPRKNKGIFMEIFAVVVSFPSGNRSNSSTQITTQAK